MIDHISIKDFAIIKNTEIDFEEGLNVITGETGSGKSIVIEAMSLALGNRADSSFVRHGAEKARVQLQAEVSGREFLISREVSAAGKNICKINDELVTRKSVSEAARLIADIHGQYDNQILLDPDNHLELVDRFHHTHIDPVKKEFSEIFRQYKAARSKLNERIRVERENRKKLDFQKFEVNEINDAALKPGEDSDLEERITVLRNSEKIYKAIHNAEELLSANENDILTQLGEISRSLQSVSTFSSELSAISRDFDNILYELQDLTGRVQAASAETSYEPGEIDRAISRMDLIDHLKSKYGKSIEEILNHRDRVASDLERSGNFAEEKAALEKETKELLEELKEKTKALTFARTQSAAQLAEAVENELNELNFNNARFEINIRKAAAISSSGGDDCEILISTNKGEPPKPLAKTASGGEISRIMLAIKNITGSYDHIPTFIFDEIDTGISGITASVVARKLKEIARHHQVICITHLPQIAAAGDANFRIEKSSDEETTYTRVTRLSPDEKTDEIARLLGGDKVTETTRRSANELISSY